MIQIDMEMPGSCADCRLCSVVEDCRCMAMPRDRDDVYMDLYVLGEEETLKPEDCPLMEVEEDE